MNSYMSQKEHLLFFQFELQTCRNPDLDIGTIHFWKIILKISFSWPNPFEIYSFGKIGFCCFSIHPILKYTVHLLWIGISPSQKNRISHFTNGGVQNMKKKAWWISRCYLCEPDPGVPLQIVFVHVQYGEILLELFPLGCLARQPSRNKNPLHSPLNVDGSFWGSRSRTLDRS